MSKAHNTTANKLEKLLKDVQDFFNPMTEEAKAAFLRSLPPEPKLEWRLESGGHTRSIAKLDDTYSIIIWHFENPKRYLLTLWKGSEMLRGAEYKGFFRAVARAEFIAKNRIWTKGDVYGHF